MFLLGHSCWSYILSKLTGRSLQINFPAYLAFLAGVLPDFDIYFRPIIIHHTYTHSILILAPIAGVLCYRYRLLGITFSVGLLSHLFTDYLVGSIPLFYPLYPNLVIGLNLGIPSIADTLLEVGAFGTVVVYAFLNGDYKLLLKPGREGLLLLIPLFAIVTLTLLFAGDNNIPLTTFAFARKALTLISVGHIVFVIILSVAVLRSLLSMIRVRLWSSTKSSL